MRQVKHIFMAFIAAAFVFAGQASAAQVTAIWGANGTDTGRFNNPNGAAVDSSGNVYIADTDNHRIQKFSASGVFVSSFGSSGVNNGLFSYPQAVAVDAAGNIYVADTGNNRIQKFNSSLTFLYAKGTSGSGNGQFSSINGIVLDASDNIYVTDGNLNARVQKFYIAPSSFVYVSQWGSSGTAPGQLSNPQGIAVDAAGNTYVADTNNARIQKFNAAGSSVAMWSAGTTPWGVAVDTTSAYVYVTDKTNNQAYKYDTSGNWLETWGETGAKQGQFNTPEGIAVAPSGGQVVVVDNGNYRAQKFNLSASPSTDSVPPYLTAVWGGAGALDGSSATPPSPSTAAWKSTAPSASGCRCSTTAA